VRLAFAAALVSCVASAAASAQVEVVRPVPRAGGHHGFTIEVPTPGAYGSFEVLRGGRVPPPMAEEEVLPAAPPAATIAPRGVAPVHVEPVRPVEVAPVGTNARGGGRTVRVQRGPFARPPIAAAPGEEQDAPLPVLPPGARVIRIR
jgi:hypothetical protein